MIYKRMILAAGYSLVAFSKVAAITPQKLQSRMHSQTLAMLFWVARFLGAKIVAEYPDGTRLDLTQFADDYEFTKRPGNRDNWGHCKEG